VPGALRCQLVGLGLRTEIVECSHLGLLHVGYEQGVESARIGCFVEHLVEEVQACRVTETAPNASE
jgi:hypothetical protein